MPISSRRLFTLGSLVCAMLAARSVAAAAQEVVSVELPAPALREIAADFDNGRNSIYCYFGQRVAPSRLSVRVDSVSIVATPGACQGVGIAFIARISDPAFLGQVLRGLIDSSPAFAVVSAFYRTEDVELDGARVHAPRALSVVRGLTASVRANGGY